MNSALKAAVLIQIDDNRRTGTCFLQECGWDASPDFTADMENELTAQAKDEIIAICSLANELRERVVAILRRNLWKTRKPLKAGTRLMLEQRGPASSSKGT